MSDPEFYIGYQSKTAPGLARHVKLWTVLMTAILIPLFVAVAFQQRPFDEGSFEFGTIKTFDGVIRTEPIPHLQLIQSADGFDAGKVLLLVDMGKHGLPEYAENAAGQVVSVGGTLIYKGDTVMLELAGENTLTIKDGTNPDPVPLEDFGPITLTGELVDTKCYLGVMRPGTGKVHRACAVNCLAGGVPPGLLVRTGDDSDTVFLLADAVGAPLTIDPQWAGRTLTVTGSLAKLKDVHVLKADTTVLQP